MISRLKFFVYMVCITLQHWFLGPAMHCWNCVDCEPYTYGGDIGTKCYCRFRGEMEMEPSDTCRAFRGWRKHGE